MVKLNFQASAGFISQHIQAVMPTATVSNSQQHCICFQLTSTSSVIERLPVPPQAAAETARDEAEPSFPVSRSALARSRGHAVKSLECSPSVG